MRAIPFAISLLVAAVACTPATAPIPPGPRVPGDGIVSDVRTLTGVVAWGDDTADELVLLVSGTSTVLLAGAIDELFALVGHRITVHGVFTGPDQFTVARFDFVAS